MRPACVSSRYGPAQDVRLPIMLIANRKTDLCVNTQKKPVSKAHDLVHFIYLFIFSPSVTPSFYSTAQSKIKSVHTMEARLRGDKIYSSGETQTKTKTKAGRQKAVIVPPDTFDTLGLNIGKLFPFLSDPDLGCTDTLSSLIY